MNKKDAYIYNRILLSHKKEIAQINNLTLYLKDLGKEEQTKPKVSRRKEITKIRVEINKRLKRQ